MDPLTEALKKQLGKQQERNKSFSHTSNQLSDLDSGEGGYDQQKMDVGL
ncbi:hypothetical protein [Sphingorhabdus sp.]